MNGLSPQKIQEQLSKVILGVVTEEAISKDAGLSAGGSLNLRVDIEVSAVTIVGSMAAKLQHRSPGGAWEDLVGANATVAITADGTFSMRQNVQVAADQPNMPIRKMIRVVVTTTNASDTAQFDNVYLSQEL